MDIEPFEQYHIARSLRMWRRIKRMKQSHLGELLNVSQATISRWEALQQLPDEAELKAIRNLLAARLDGSADKELARLVSSTCSPVHLICDLTHKLLALSRARERYCKVHPNDLLGTSLWPYASEDIIALEKTLQCRGWFEPAPPAIEGLTEANGSAKLAIVPSRVRYVRFQLSDGTFVRTVETLPV